ncbi:hypothetical protein CUMW_117440 [Citrus unshiu]|nr:hypothetical protein CUMW_117440 [Citrus unshiu]
MCQQEAVIQFVLYHLLFNLAWKTAYVEAGSTAIIVGLILYEVAKVARLCGGTRITGVDVNQEKFEIGE